jgi:hypothetical protein
MYKIPAKIRIDLSELGDNNGTPFFVEIKDSRMMTYGEKRDKLRIIKENEGAKADIEMARSLIVDWNLTSVEGGSPVDFKDEDAFEKVPGVVIDQIYKEYLAIPKLGETEKN